MDKLSKFSKLFAYISFLSGLLWIGSYLTRLMTSYSLFTEENFELKNFITQENLSGIITIISTPITITFILYIIFILSFIIFLLTSKLSLKKNGWLFIITLIILITLPFEIYLMAIDFKIISTVFSGSFDANLILNIIIKRFKILSSFPVIEIFCYFAIVFFVLFQPLKMKTTKE